MSAAGQMQASALRLFWWVGAPSTSMASGNAGDIPAALSPATVDMLRASGRPLVSGEWVSQTSQRHALLARRGALP